MPFIINKEQITSCNLFHRGYLWIHCLGSNHYQFLDANKQKDLTSKPMPITSGIWI